MKRIAWKRDLDMEEEEKEGMKKGMKMKTSRER